MRITSDGRLGVGTTTPTQKLDVNGIVKATNGSFGANVNTQGVLNLSNNGAEQLEFFCGASSGVSQIQAFNRSDSTYDTLEFISLDTRFKISGTERMRIDSSGNVMAGGAGSTADVIFPNAVGIVLENTGSIQCSRSGVAALSVNRKTNDGQLQRFFQDGNLEGDISVSGATVSYNGFTGSHWSRFIDESKPDVLRGTVMESLDQMTNWYNAEFETSYTEQDKEGNDIIEQVQATIVKQVDVKHVMSKISDTVEAKNVYGVFSAWDNDDLINNDFYVASVGSYVVRIKAGQVVAKGDLLQSNGDGTAKVQADDMIRASTFAKVLSNTVIDTYEDGSFIVPCSLMC